MEVGEKCICQYDDWYNDFGDRSEAIHRGMRLTVSGRKNVAGAIYYSFEEVDEKNWYWSPGFKPMKSLN